KNGVILCQVRYRDGGDWPIAADGAGHSLVLQQIHGTADDWRNWRASAVPLGSPGEADALGMTALDSSGEAVLTEVHFGPNRSVDWVEVIHRSGPPFAPGGLRVASKRDFSDAVVVPGVLEPQGRAVLTARFPAEGSGRERKLYLVTASGRVIDAREFPIIGPEESWQRFPEHSPEWCRGTPPSHGRANRPARQDQVVINEIMYDPPAGSGVPEFIELVNSGPAPVDLSGWQFTDGVEFHFPTGTMLEPGAFGVIGGDAQALRTVYGNLPVLGEFRGKLSNQGERLRLVDGLGNLASEVDYRTGGNWPASAAGKGSSLELAHPLMEGRLPSAWRGSDEAGKSHFQVFRHEGVYEELRPLGEISDFRELHLHLVEEGHVILRNLRLRHQQTGEDLLDFKARESRDGTGTGGWLIQGNHATSHWDGEELHVVSEGHGDNRANRLEIDVPRLERGTRCVLSFEARWVSGCPRLIAQTWDHSVSFSVRLPVPGNLGTPGRANSRLTARPLPQLDGLRHSPAVPAPGEAVRVTALVTSAEPPGHITLFHRLDTLAGDAEWRSTPMIAEPPASDAPPGAGREYAATLIEYGNAGQVVQFCVQVGGPGETGQSLPVGGRDQPAMFVVDGRALPGGLRTARFVVSTRDLASISPLRRTS
ncbi:MAG TPA: hypothetical protein DCY13_10550, partial [Verrucomicrobiales bacterium]|nr:hypothetical protein [Verrucomicrobiales bacterium]